MYCSRITNHNCVDVQQKFKFNITDTYTVGSFKFTHIFYVFFKYQIFTFYMIIFLPPYGINKASLAQWKSTGLVNQGSGDQSSLEAIILNELN